MKTTKKVNFLFLALTCFSLSSCEDFLEIDTPNHKMISNVVFDSDEMAISAMQGIYNQLYVQSFTGGNGSVTVLAGLSADDLSPISSTVSIFPYGQFDEHDILPDNSLNFNLWSGSYNIIYLTNSLLEGIENSVNISDDVYSQLKGEASFVRAFTHFYLLNLYGEVPLVLSTNYQENATSSKNSINAIYDQILLDLESAKDLVADSLGDERTQITGATVKAMLARVHLYHENWELAERYSSEVINQSADYELLADLNQVFLANSREAIWQLTPKGVGTQYTQTKDGNVLIINPVLAFFAQIKLDPRLVNTFQSNDERFKWIGFNPSLGVHFAYKYKVKDSQATPIEEYSMVLRLAEQYLIRAEARARSGDIINASSDLDQIRRRAGIQEIFGINPPPTKEQLIDLILEERHRELFAEWGHRWFDLKRTGRVKEFLSYDNPDWEETDEYFPIPEQDRMKNPNL